MSTYLGGYLEYSMLCNSKEIYSALEKFLNIGIIQFCAIYA